MCGGAIGSCTGKAANATWWTMHFFRELFGRIASAMLTWNRKGGIMAADEVVDRALLRLPDEIRALVISSEVAVEGCATGRGRRRPV